MDKDTFDPKTFFALHDLNADGLWNDEEIEALFQIELEKVYNDTNPDDDPRERFCKNNWQKMDTICELQDRRDEPNAGTCGPANGQEWRSINLITGISSGLK
jgi:hypothetical protein